MSKTLHIYKTFRSRKIILPIIVLLLNGHVAFSQSPASTAEKIKAVFLFNFTQFVDWPASSFSSEDAPFIIGIVGDDPFGSYIEETVSGEKVGTHVIIIKRFNFGSEISNCQILYINSEDDSRVKKIISSIRDKSILTVGEATFFNRLGGIVRFYTEQSKIHFEINTDAAKIAQLNVSSKLLNVAKTK